MFKTTPAELRLKANEILTAAATGPVVPLSEVRRPDVYRHLIKPITADGFGFAVLDMVLSRDGTIRLIEMNGSNAGATSYISPDGDLPRARHFVQSLSSTLQAHERAAVVIGYAPKTGLLHEIVERAYQVAKLVRNLRSVALRRANEALGNEDVAVVVDDIPAIAREVSREGGKLLYRGWPVAAASNANILPELVRTGVVARIDSGYDVDAYFHDGPLAPLTHDRSAQQLIAGAGTGIEPQRHDVAHSTAESLEVIASFHRDGLDVFGKANAGSGSAGVEVFPAPMSTGDIMPMLERLIGGAVEAYGESAALTIWPLRFFEATWSTPYELAGEDHLYDARFCCFISPGKVKVIPADMRICPSAFSSERITRESVIANTTGRRPTAAFMRCPLAAHASGLRLEFQHAGISDENFERMLEGAARWCEAAWHYSVGLRASHSKAAEIDTF